MKNKFKIIIIFFIFYFLFSSHANAAILNLVSPVSEIGINQQFQVDLMLDAEGQNVNAVEGNIIFQKNLLEIKEIYIGSSIVNFWVEKPQIGAEPARGINAEIKFSGIIPGGFSGVLSPYYKGEKPGKVFSVVFAAKKEGSGAVEIRDAKVLLNDGQGTQASLAISNFKFQVSSLIQDTKYQIPDTIIKDTDPPELFTPEIANDPNVFDGHWFLVFAAQDKISGIDGYFVHETTQKKDITQINTNDWIAAKSPYLLTDQKLRSYIYVKAVDKAGNSRIVYLPPRAPWYKKWPVYIFIGLGVMIVLLLSRWLWRKYRKIVHE